MVTHGTLATNWTPVLDMNMAGTAYLTHTGTYRWWCRYRTTSGTAVQLRGVYDVGDLVMPEENLRWTHPAETAGTAFYVADLGQIRLDQAPVGTHRWAGQIQAKGDAGSENVSIDRVWFQPLDESAGLLRAPLNADVGLATYSARSEFNTESGAITGDTAAVGGVWVGAGDADDFSVAAGVATRTAVSDAATTGRYITLNVNLTDTVVQADSRSSVAVTAVRRGVIARYADVSNWFKADLIYVSAGVHTLDVDKRVAGAITSVSDTTIFGLPDIDDVAVRMMVLASGVWVVWVGPQGSSLSRVASGQDSALATGGSLATGDPGVYDENTSATACTRTYDNFAAWAPVPNAVLNPSQSLELRTDGIVREDVSGSAYGPVSWVEGDLPRLPPTVGGTTEVFAQGVAGATSRRCPISGIDDVCCPGHVPAVLAAPEQLGEDDDGPVHDPETERRGLGGRPGCAGGHGRRAARDGQGGLRRRGPVCDRQVGQPPRVRP